MKLLRDTSIRESMLGVKVSKDELDIIKKYAQIKGFKNCSEFIRAVLNESLSDYKKVLSEE